MRLLAAIHRPDATQSILVCLDLPSRAPPVAAPQADNTEAGVRWAEDFDAGARAQDTTRAEAARAARYPA